MHLQTLTMSARFLSVVMACHNNELTIIDSIQCIVNQTFRNWELIVVNDGSTDATEKRIEQIASTEPRIRVVHQSNQGLTEALINGCRLAKGPLIARQDVGDLSLPDRFERQLRFLEQNCGVVAAGSSVRWIGPKSEYLGDWVRHQTPSETTLDLTENGTGFVHPSVMFRKDAYELAGGYRNQFRFAQDHDLWYRMAEIGMLGTCPEVLFEYRMDVSGISPQHRTRQERLGQLARECYLARKNGLSEESLLKEANRVSWDENHADVSGSASGPGDAAYFVGSQLYQQRDRRCRKYLKMALTAKSNRLRSAVKFASSFLICHGGGAGA